MREVRKNQNISETIPLTPPLEAPSTSGINRNYGSIVSILKKKLSLSSFHNQVNCLINSCLNKTQHVFL